MASETEVQKRKRFKFSLAMVLVFVPFMVLWNMYGNFMIKQDYFKVDYTTSRTYYGGTTKRYYPAGHPTIPTGNSTTSANETSKEAQSNDEYLKNLTKPESVPSLKLFAVSDLENEFASTSTEKIIDSEEGTVSPPVEPPTTPTRKPSASSAKQTYVPEKGEFECKLDTWYQMLSILYMLLIYCEIVVFIIFSCTFLSYIKRFFLIVDEIPFEQQRRLPVSEGGRGHPLIRRSFQDYQDAFDYAHFVLSRGRVNRLVELRYLQNYKNRKREANLRNRIKTVTYKVKKSKRKEESVDTSTVSLAKEETSLEESSDHPAPETSSEQTPRKQSKVSRSY